MRVVLTEPVHPAAVAMLREAGWQVLEAAPGAALPAAEALMVRIRRLTEAEVAAVRMISKHGTGVDNIPLAAARAAGVVVANTPGANAGAVAEQAALLLLALLRDLDGQRAGRVQGLGGAEGRRLVIAGYGASGRRLARVMAALGMAVTVVARPGSAAEAAALAEGLAVAPLAEALAGADALSLHLPLTEATRGLIEAAELAAMAPGAVVVNCARGGLVDEAALVAALEAGHLGGAGLDATEVEPLPAGHPLRSTARVILTPHAAGLSQGAFRRVGEEAARNLIDWAAGRLRPEVTVVAGR